MKVIAVTDSDSYVKWGATIVDRMPAAWQRSLVVIRTPALPSGSQLASALSGTRFTVEETPVVDLADLASLIRDEKPDVVVLSVRGPVVRVLVRMIVANSTNRPVIVSGLPGISIPETLNALYYRSQVDLIVLHSKREVRAFAALAASLGIRQDFGLATLPFLRARQKEAAHGKDIVFAPQAKVPKSLEDRTQLLDWLVEAARHNPGHRVVIKLRGASGEAQTHAEKYPYDTLMLERDDIPENLVTSTGPMSEHLQQAAALVTVSSTAALEAMAAGVPVLAIDDFGVAPQFINTVFEASGVLGHSTSLLIGGFRHPSEHWLDDNYFHAPSDETWVERIEMAVAMREQGGLMLRPQFRGSLGGNLRRIWDRKRALGPYDRSFDGYLALAVGLPLRGAIRRYRQLRARRAPERQPEFERVG